jgi:hypothetical protein
MSFEEIKNQVMDSAVFIVLSDQGRFYLGCYGNILDAFRDLCNVSSSEVVDVLGLDDEETITRDQITEFLDLSGYYITPVFGLSKQKTIYVELDGNLRYKKVSNDVPVGAREYKTYNF